jgi:hypothetical protein
MGAKVLAVIMPLAATAGIPIPGKVESPQQNKLAKGVLLSGNLPLPAIIAGP